MNSLISPLSFLTIKPSSFTEAPFLRLGCHQYSQFRRLSLDSIHPAIVSLNPFGSRSKSIGTTIPSNEGAVSVVQFEDFVEKDWSFLDEKYDDELRAKIDRIISSGNILENSKVLLSSGSEPFVDRLVDTTSCESLLVVHDSLFILACIKEKYDKINCWQGELINVPEKWTHFDVVFLYFLPGLPFELGEVLGVLAPRCLPGARIVISHPQGRQGAEEQRLSYPDVMVSNFPEGVALRSTAAGNSFEVTELVDETGFYLAVLRLNSEPKI